MSMGGTVAASWNNQQQLGGKSIQQIQIIHTTTCISSSVEANEWFAAPSLNPLHECLTLRPRAAFFSAP